MNLLPEFQQATDKLTPAEYQRYLQGIELTDITLEGLETSVNRLAVESSETFQLRLERKLRIDVQPDRQPALLVEYLVRGMARQKVAVKVRATYRLQIETERPLPVEFFAIYGKLSADMQVWPYFRELVSAVTSRMGVPRLTLPLRKEQTLLRESADKAGA